MIGIYKSRSVSLSRIASKIPGKAQLLSYTPRLSRFLDNSAIDVRSCYERQTQSLQQVRLIVDGTKVGFGHQLLMVSLAYRKRSIPIAWSWVPHVRGHSTANTQLALLRYIRSLFAQRRGCFAGRRHRIWLDTGTSTTGSVALALCFAAKDLYARLFSPANRLE